MSIFGKIKDAIFGGRGPFSGNYVGKDERPAGTTATAGTAPAQQPHAAPAAQAPTPQAAPQAAQPVDVEAVLSQKAAAHGGNLNWRSSIVDLMKLLDLDSSLDNRKELATELGYTGAKDGSAEMNIWLHKAVMRELAKNGGKVPAGLAD